MTMGGNRTWKRTLVTKSPGVYTRANGTKVDVSATTTTKQTTSSFRSGREEGYVTPRNRQEYLAYLDANQRFNRYDNGHEFKTTRETSLIMSHREFSVYGKHGARWLGPLTYTAPFSIPGEPVWDHARDGAALINRAIPTHPQASFATFAGELLLGGLPRAFTEYAPQVMKSLKVILGDLPRRKWPKNPNDVVDFASKGASQHYLNVYWGYLPMVNDLTKMVASIVYANPHLDQYFRDSGRPVRRRRRLPPVASTGPVTPHASGVSLGLMPGKFDSTNFPDLFSSVSDSQGTVTYVDNVHVETWFSGAFTYHAPEGDDVVSQLKVLATKAEKLFGLRLTPEVLWNITPWSWFVDWNTNTGNVISNATRMSEDGLIMRYGYVMRKTVATRTYTHTGVRFQNGLRSGPIMIAHQRIIKERRRGNPFGFSLLPPAYNARQWAALAAVGLSGSSGLNVRAY